MKKLALFGMVVFLITSTVPSYGFLDYFFSGSASRDAIDNSAVGDLRAWWTGNPGYQFNPYWSGPQPNQQANPSNPASTQGYSPMGAPSAGTSQAPPTVNYYPQQAPGQPGQGMYGGAPQQYQQVPQQYQASPQQYQQVPQQYQAPPQQYQQVPQQYQPAPQQYPAPSAYQGAPQAYQGVAQQQAPLPQAYPAGTQQYQGGR
jgi:hypothetical protein